MEQRDQTISLVPAGILLVLSFTKVHIQTYLLIWILQIFLKFILYNEMVEANVI